MLDQGDGRYTDRSFSTASSFEKKCYAADDVAERMRHLTDVRLFRRIPVHRLRQHSGGGTLGELHFPVHLLLLVLWRGRRDGEKCLTKRISHAG